jgi:hypothetical protein
VSAAERAQQVTEPSAAPEKPPPSKSEVRKSAAQALKEHLSKDKPESEPKPKQADKQEAKDAKPEGDAKGRAPDGKFASKDQQPAETKPPAAETKPAPARPDGELEGRLARTVRELNSSTAQVNDYRRKHDGLAAENTALKAKLEAAKTNPYDLLEEAGWNLEKVVQATVDGKIKPRGQRMDLPPEVKQQLDELKADKDQRAQRDQAEARARMRTEQTGNIKKYIEQNAERYPFAAAHDWAASSVWELALSGGKQAADALPVLQALEADLAANTAAVLGNERAFKALLKSNPKLRESLIAALGVGTSKEANPAASHGAGNGSADGPRSVSSLPSGQTPPPPDKLTKEQRKQQAVRAFRDLRREAG